MKKIVLILLMGISHFVMAQHPMFQSLTTGNTAQQIGVGSTTFLLFNIKNTGSDSVNYFFYNVPSVPTYTNTPYYYLDAPPFGRIFNASPTLPNVVNFSNGCWVRSVVKGLGTYTTTADPTGVFSYTVSPHYPQVIEIVH